MSFQVKLRGYGAWRKYEKSAPSVLSFNSPIKVSELKIALEQECQRMIPHFTDSQLITDSAIANDQQVLALNHVIDGPCELLILPPVCGG